METDPDADLVVPGEVSPRRTVPDGIARPDYSVTGRPGPRSRSLVKAPEAVERMRAACRAARHVLDLIGRHVAPGVTTDELDAIAHDEYIRLGGYPSTLNYQGYPKSICTSVNEVICHGIPDDRPLQDGDIVNLDVTIYLDGMHGDCSATFPVGTIDEASKRLMAVTHECLLLGVEAVRPGVRVNEIGRAIERHAIAHDMGVVRAFTGHGIGETFHMDPQVPHFYDPRADDELLPGMTFTIEPMITLGTWRHIVLEDDWTAVTADGRRTAQYEHTVLVTEDGVEILTGSEADR